MSLFERPLAARKIQTNIINVPQKKCTTKKILFKQSQLHSRNIKNLEQEVKLKPIHPFLADTLKQIFGKEYELHYLGSNAKEKT
jgi:hypothetical protein